MITFEGDESSFLFAPLSENAEMEVIPLAGNENFWKLTSSLPFIWRNPVAAFQLLCYPKK